MRGDHKDESTRGTRVKPYAPPKVTPITDPEKIARLDEAFGVEREAVAVTEIHSTCDGCRIEIISLACRPFTVLVRSPGGLEVESVFCSDCALRLAMIGVKLFPRPTEPQRP